MTVLSPIKKSKDVYTVIDIGNNKISCLIGTSIKTNDVQIKVLGLGNMHLWE